VIYGSYGKPVVLFILTVQWVYNIKSCPLSFYELQLLCRLAVNAFFLTH